MAKKVISKGIAEGLKSASKVLRKQSKKEISKSGFDNSKVVTGEVKVTKINKSKTGNARKKTGAKKVTPNAKKTPVKKAVKKTTPVKTTAPKKPLTTAQKKVNDSVVKAGGKASANPKVKKNATKKPATNRSEASSKGWETRRKNLKARQKEVAKLAKSSKPKSAYKTKKPKSAYKTKTPKKSQAQKKTEADLNRPTQGPRTLNEYLKGRPTQGPSGVGAFKAGKKSGRASGVKRTSAMARSVGKTNTLGKKAKRATKRVAKKAKPLGIPAASLGAGYLGGKAGASSSKPAKTQSKAPMGYTKEELLKARKAVYGY